MGYKNTAPEHSHQGPWANQFWSNESAGNQASAYPSDADQSAVYPPYPTVNGDHSKTFATFCHLGVYLGYSLLPVAGFFLGPMIVWLLKKDESPFVDFHGREAMNFQISCLLWMLISIPLCLIGIGFVTFFLAILASLLWPIYAAIKSADGHWYRYPLTWRFI